MSTNSFTRKLRRFNIVTHRDVGYFFSALVIVYCLSGIALNHINEWNPDFIITKEEVDLKQTFTRENVTPELVKQFGNSVGETTYKVYDFPTNHQVKVYYQDASLLINLTEGKGVYERISRRPIFYQSNVLHRNSAPAWKWASDVFAVMLIVINVTGLFILKGKHGLGGRGKWLIAAGALPPLIVLIINGML
ncbi:MAG: hypothetical protein UZ12_BCD005003420 [Bacteroidetes bacterium OLB12]|nr:MAG: hypothetical protein UZ12_BCD005003420 [Bacteroidetes bacterium OLB12]